MVEYLCLQALTEAILAVTSMNADLSVEKIEIVHNKAVTQWSCQHYAWEEAAPLPRINLLFLLTKIYLLKP